MKTHLVLLIATAAVAVCSPRLATAQSESTTTAEEVAMEAAETAMREAEDAGFAASKAEDTAAQTGRDVDKDRARILRERADEAMKKAIEAVKKADAALDGVPDGQHLWWLQHRLGQLLGSIRFWGYPLPDTKNDDHFPRDDDAAAQKRLQDALAEGAKNPSSGAMRVNNALLGRLLVGLTGTGETIGHIADAQLKNPTSAAIAGVIPATVLFSLSGNYQPYVVPRMIPFVIAPGATKSVPIQGLCMDARRPPAGPENKGELVMFDSASEDFPKSLTAQVSGAGRLIETVSELQKKGAITTPFSGNPEREREAVIQQTFWIYTAARTARPYTKAEFANKLYSQGGFQPPNDLTPPVPLPETTIPKTPSGAVITPDPKITKKPNTVLIDPGKLIPVTGDAAPGMIATEVPVIGYQLNPPAAPNSVAVTFNNNKPAGSTPPTTPSGAVITPEPKITKQPTDAQKQMLDKGIDQFWDTFQLAGKEAKILD